MSWRDRPGAPPAGTVLLRSDELGEMDTRGLGFGSGRDRFEMFLVRRDGIVYAYVNDCPHAHTTLEFTPDRFLSFDRQYLLCSTHGAEFGIEDGVCVRGPVKGRRLTPVPVAEANGFIRIVE